MNRRPARIRATEPREQIRPRIRAWRALSEKIAVARLRELKEIADRLYDDFRVTSPQLDWWTGNEFNDYLSRFGERRHPNTHRRWMLRQPMRLTGHVASDTAELGAYKGTPTYLICDTNRTQKSFARIHHMFDSFEGLSELSPVDGEYWQLSDLSAQEDVVARNLAEFTATIRFLKGWIPCRFAAVAERTSSCVHIDVDPYKPTYDSIGFFYPRSKASAVLLCEDYAFAACPRATRAIDAFLDDKPEELLRLDAGGGFFSKGCEGAP